LNAFTGILRALATNNDEQFLFALPESSFNWALLWQSQDSQRDQEENQTSFLSWPWLSWKGVILWWPELMRKPSNCPVIQEITWYSLGTDGTARMLSSKQENNRYGDNESEILRSQWKHPRTEPSSYTLTKSTASFVNSSFIGAYTSHAHVKLKIDLDEAKALILNDASLEIGSLSWSHKPRENGNDDDPHKLIVLSRRNVDLFSDEKRPTLNVMLVMHQGHREIMKCVAIGTVDEEEVVEIRGNWLTALSLRWHFNHLFLDSSQ
jgi:hypothetical protein